MSLNEFDFERIRQVVKEELTAAGVGREEEIPIPMKQAAEAVHVTPECLRRWTRAGRITATGHPHRPRYLLSEIKKAIEDRLPIRPHRASSTKSRVPKGGVQPRPAARATRQEPRAETRSTTP